MPNDIQPRQPSAIQSILYGALIYFVIAVIPYLNLLNAFGFGIALAGGFSAWHYIKRIQHFSGYFKAFQIGAASALVGGVVLFLLRGGAVLRLFYDIGVCLAVGGISGVISASVIRRGLPQKAEAEK
jgi:Na+/melibiose symporter-like transporter